MSTASNFEASRGAVAVRRRICRRTLCVSARQPAFFALGATNIRNRPKSAHFAVKPGRAGRCCGATHIIARCKPFRSSLSRPAAWSPRRLHGGSPPAHPGADGASGGAVAARPGRAADAAASRSGRAAAAGAGRASVPAARGAIPTGLRHRRVADRRLSRPRATDPHSGARRGRDHRRRRCGSAGRPCAPGVRGAGDRLDGQSVQLHGRRRRSRREHGRRGLRRVALARVPVRPGGIGVDARGARRGLRGLPAVQPPHGTAVHGRRRRRRPRVRGRRVRPARLDGRYLAVVVPAARLHAVHRSTRR